MITLILSFILKFFLKITLCNWSRSRTFLILRLRLRTPEYAITRISDEMTTFQLFITKCIEDIIMTNTNREGIRVYKKQWKPIDYIELQAYIGL